MKNKYYTLKNILKENADYNVVFGKRSNGKSFSGKELILFGFHENGININGYLDDGSQGAILRRMEEDFRKGRGSSMWSDIISNPLNGNMLEKATDGKWNYIKFYSMAWYLCKIEDGKEILVDNEPFCYSFALSSAEHIKSNQFPKITNIMFDEFIATMGYLINEFILFTSVISTIKRDRQNIKVFLFGNSINMINPYFTEMGLTNAKKMKKNTIDVYKYGNSDLKVAVEYTGDIVDEKDKSKKKIDKWFAFDNPRLKMITTGDWELDIYPHLPYKYKPKDIIYTYFIVFEGETFQCEIIDVDYQMKPFTYIHRKTTPIKEGEPNIIYSQGYSTEPNHKRKIIHALSDIERKIVWFFQNERVFYQNNEVGNMIDNYIEWCRNSK
ncbi:MAG: phage DNA encapsidation protein [Bacilli bacterium]|nr:phage DNA encapsidation protein [Bacilli bacterium]